jgi:hypothetical protein
MKERLNNWLAKHGPCFLKWKISETARSSFQFTKKIGKIEHCFQENSNMLSTAFYFLGKKREI